MNTDRVKEASLRFGRCIECVMRSETCLPKQEVETSKNDSPPLYAEEASDTLNTGGKKYENHESVSQASAVSDTQGLSARGVKKS